MPLTPDTDWQEGGKSAFFRCPKGKEGTDWEFKIRNDLKALHFHTIGHIHVLVVCYEFIVIFFP